MFDYTKSILIKTYNDLNLTIRFARAFNLVAQLLFIAYQAYMTFSGSPIWYVHLALLIVTASYFVFDMIMTHAISDTLLSAPSKKAGSQLAKELKGKKHAFRKVKKLIAYSLNSVVITFAIITMAIYPEKATPFAIVSTTLMVVIILLDLLFELVLKVATDRTRLIVEALKIDTKAPIDKIKSTFRKWLRKDNTEEPEPSKDREYLDSLVSERRAEAEAKKAESGANVGDKISSWLDKQINKFRTRDTYEADYTDPDDTNGRNN